MVSLMPDLSKLIWWIHRHPNRLRISLVLKLSGARTLGILSSGPGKDSIAAYACQKSCQAAGVHSYIKCIERSAADMLGSKANIVIPHQISLTRQRIAHSRCRCLRGPLPVQGCARHLQIDVKTLLDDHFLRKCSDPLYVPRSG